jgi:putative ABC transport system permease protein
VATVVGVVSVISGLNGYVKDKVIGLNPDIVIFTKYGIITSRVEWLMARKRRDLTLTDMEVVRRECRLCAEVGARGDRRRPVKYGDRTTPEAEIQGHTPNMGEAMRFDINEGRYFTESEYNTGAPVAIIGWDVQDELFGGLDPLGRTIKIDGYPVRVIGTLAKQGSVLGQSQDNVVYIPLTLFHKHIAPTEDIGIFIKPKGGVEAVTATTDEVRTILRALRKTGYNDDDPFGLVTAELLQTLWHAISAGLFLLMIFISGISLVVGAIVIANIMFVSVVERTKEIGVRRALGARRRDIRRQFLLEAAMLASIGGVIGVLVGAAIALAVKQVFPAEVHLSFILLGIGVATVAGVLAGWIPSNQASKLPPVEALRYE